MTFQLSALYFFSNKTCSDADMHQYLDQPATLFLTASSHQLFSLFIISIIQYYNKVHRYTIKIKPGGKKHGISRRKYADQSLIKKFLIDFKKA